eukprot:2349770-Amphidinium_carterae.1
MAPGEGHNALLRSIAGGEGGLDTCRVCASFLSWQAVVSGGAHSLTNWGGFHVVPVFRLVGGHGHCNFNHLKFNF